MATGKIGVSTPRAEGVGKVTGEAVYAVDVTLPDMSWGKVLRSPIPYGRIKRIDTSRAEQAPGVRAVITGADVARAEDRPAAVRHVHPGGGRGPLRGGEGGGGGGRQRGGGGTGGGAHRGGIRGPRSGARPAGGGQAFGPADPSRRDELRGPHGPAGVAPPTLSCTCPGARGTSSRASTNPTSLWRTRSTPSPCTRATSSPTPA